MNPLLKRFLFALIVIFTVVYILIYQGTKAPVMSGISAELSQEQLRKLSQQIEVRKVNGSFTLMLNNRSIAVKTLAVEETYNLQSLEPLHCECRTHHNVTVPPVTLSHTKLRPDRPSAPKGFLQRMLDKANTSGRKKITVVKKPSGPNGEPPPIPPHIENSTTLVLMLSYQRSGSSFMGDLLNRNPSIFYVYEPLDAVYSHLYGIPPGWSVPSDITGNKDGSVRNLPQHELEATADTISNLFTCQFHKLPNEVLISQFWTQFWDHQINLLDFTKCLQRQRINVAKCQSLYLRRYCSPRFGITPSRDEKCRDFLSNPALTRIANSPQGKYLRCVLEKTEAAKQCFPSLESRCSNSEIRGAKTVRATMDLAAVLLKRHPELKILHLFRDPRPVMMSRSKHQSFRSYAARKNIAIESKFYCGVVNSDLNKRRELERLYPGRIREIIYEEFVSDPLRYSKDIYSFLGINYPNSVEQWLSKSTKKSSSIAGAWKDKIHHKDRTEMEKNCQSLFKYGAEVWEPIVE